VVVSRSPCSTRSGTCTLPILYIESKRKRTKWMKSSIGMHGYILLRHSLDRVERRLQSQTVGVIARCHLHGYSPPQRVSELNDLVRLDYAPRGEILQSGLGIQVRLFSEGLPSLKPYPRWLNMKLLTPKAWCSIERPNIRWLMLPVLPWNHRNVTSLSLGTN